MAQIQSVVTKKIDGSVDVELFDTPMDADFNSQDILNEILSLQSAIEHGEMENIDFDVSELLNPPSNGVEVVAKASITPEQTEEVVSTTTIGLQSDCCAEEDKGLMDIRKYVSNFVEHDEPQSNKRKRAPKNSLLRKMLLEPVQRTTTSAKVEEPIKIKKASKRSIKEKASLPAATNSLTVKAEDTSATTSHHLVALPANELNSLTQEESTSHQTFLSTVGQWIDVINLDHMKCLQVENQLEDKKKCVREKINKIRKKCNDLKRMEKEMAKQKQLLDQLKKEVAKEKDEIHLLEESLERKRRRCSEKKEKINDLFQLNKIC